MSSLTDSFATSKVTVWSMTGRDDYGKPTFSAPVVYGCNWKSGGRTAKDNQGVEFVPRTTIWPSVANGVINRGDYVMIGDQSATADPTTVESEIVRVAQSFDASYFGWSDDVVVLTG